MHRADLKSKTVCFIDCGLFISFAAKVAPAFNKVYYWTPWINGFPKSNSLLPGEGIDGVERVRYWEPLIDEVDLWVFPDVYFGPMQEMLVNMGKRVWGSRRGESLELKRWTTKQLMNELGMPLPHTVLIRGTDALKKYLQEHDNVFIKVSAVRGDMETWQSENWDLSETRFDLLERELGAKKHIAEFVVEDAIEDEEDDPCIEIGFDGWVIDGRSPDIGMCGIEIKDQGYVLAVRPTIEIPAPIMWVNRKLAPFMRDCQYRGFFSTEIRYKSGVPYLLDPTCRCGSPPSEIYQELFTNWPEILWEGAEGNVVEPEPIYPFGACALIHSSFADSNWQPIEFPDDIRQWVKLRNHCRINDVDYVVPQECKLPEIGAVVGVGQTMEEAIDHLKENAAQVKGYYVECKLDCLPKALEEVATANEMGLDILGTMKRHDQRGHGGGPFNIPVTPTPPATPATEVLVGAAEEPIEGAGGESIEPANTLP